MDVTLWENKMGDHQCEKLSQGQKCGGINKRRFVTNIWNIFGNVKFDKK
jgi:hypothetical protein